MLSSGDSAAAQHEPSLTVDMTFHCLIRKDGNWLESIDGSVLVNLALRLASVFFAPDIFSDRK